MLNLPKYLQSWLILVSFLSILGFILFTWRTVSSIVSQIPLISFSIFPLQISLHGVQLHRKIIVLLQYFISDYIPVDILQIYIHTLNIRLTFDKNEMILVFVLDSLDIRTILTHAKEWESGSRSSALRMAQQYKHRQVQDLSNLMELFYRPQKRKKISLFEALFDYFIRNLRLTVNKFELNMIDSGEPFSYGLITRDFTFFPITTTSNDANTVTNATILYNNSNNSTTHHMEVSFFGLYIDPQRNLENRNYLFQTHKAISVFEMPDIFGTMLQYGLTPDGREKRLAFTCHLVDVQFCFQQTILQAFLYKLIKFIGIFEYWAWKDQGRKRMTEQEIRLSETDIQQLLGTYTEIFLKYRAANKGRDKDLLYEQILLLESEWTVSSIMSLRRRILGWVLPSDIDGNFDPFLPYISGDDPQDFDMSRFIASKRVEYEQNSCYISEFRLDSPMKVFCTLFSSSEEVDPDDILPFLSDYRGKLLFIFSATEALFSFVYRFYPVYDESSTKKLQISMYFKGIHLQENRPIDETACKYLLDSSLPDNGNKQNSEEGSAWNLQLEYSYPGSGSNGFYVVLHDLLLPIHALQQYIDYFKLVIDCLIYSASSNSSKNEASVPISRSLSDELLFKGRNLIIQLSFSAVKLIVAFSPAEHPERYMYLELTGSLKTNSSPSAESFLVALSRFYLRRSALSHYTGPVLHSKWTSVAETRRRSKPTILCLRDLTIQTDVAVDERTIGEKNLTWSEVELIDKVNIDGLHRVGISVTSLKLTKKIRKQLNADSIFIQIVLDADKDTREVHPYSFTSHDEVCTYEFLAPLHSEGHSITVMLTDGSRNIGSCQFILSNRIYLASFSMFALTTTSTTAGTGIAIVFSSNEENQEQVQELEEEELIGKIEVKGDIGLPLLKLSVRSMRLYHQVLAEDQVRGDAVETMHFIVSALLPPDGESSIVLASSSLPIEAQISLKERFLVPCHPGRYFPLNIALYKEGERSDECLGSSNITFSGDSTAQLNTVILKDQEMDIAEIVYDFQWYQEGQLDAEVESSTAHDLDTAAEEISTTGEEKLLPTTAAVLVSSFGILSRHIRRNIAINFHSIQSKFIYQDFVLILAGVKDIEQRYFVAVTSDAEEQWGVSDLKSPPPLAPRRDLLSTFEGILVPQCKDYVWESTFIRTILENYPDLSSLLADCPPSVKHESLWTLLSEKYPIVDLENTKTFDSSSIYDMQLSLVKQFQNYQFAKNVWGLLMIPKLFYLPCIGNIKVKSGKFHGQMESPVGIGSCPFNDTNTIITSLDPWLRAQCLTGIKTSKADNLNSELRFLQFEVDRPCVVYLCWDMRSRNVPKWVSKWGFQKVDMYIQTTITTHVVLYRSFNISSKIALGGCGMKQSFLESYIVLIGLPLNGNKVQIPNPIQLYWKFRPSSEIHNSGSHSIGVRPHKSITVFPLTDTASLNGVKLLSALKVSIQGGSAVFAIGDGSSNRAVLSICAQSLLIDATFRIEGNNLTDMAHFVSRSSGIQWYSSWGLHVTSLWNNEPIYIIEPWRAFCVWNKTSGDLNHSAEFASTEVMVTNLYPEIVTTICAIARDMKAALDDVTLTKAQTRRLDIASYVSQSSDEYNPRRPYRLFPSTEGVARTLSYHQPSIVIENRLGVDIRLWITGAGFIESSETSTAYPDDSRNIYDSAEESAGLSYCHEAILLAGGSISVVFFDPFAPSSTDMLREDTEELLNGVRIDCELEGWTDVGEIRLSDKDTALYPIAPLTIESRSSWNDKSSMQWANLSNGSFGESTASPLVRWRREKHPKHRASPHQTEDEKDEDGTLDIFLTDFQKVHVTPFALKVQCSTSAPLSSSGMQISVVFSTNIHLRNDTGVPIYMLCRDDIVFADVPVPVSVSELWPVHLQMLKEEHIRFDPKSAGIPSEMSIPIVKELLNPAISETLRRSNETDLHSFTILPEHTEPLRGDKSRHGGQHNEGLLSWVFVLAPALTICNATACPVKIQILQPPEATPDRYFEGVYNDVRGLFFLPDEYYTRTGEGSEWDVDLRPEEANIFVLTFTDTNLLHSCVVESGHEFSVPFLRLDRTVYYRVGIGGKWSHPYSIDKRLYGLKARYDKHKSEAVLWEATSSGTGMPSLFLKKSWSEWQQSRRIDLFCTFIVVNKTGMLLRYSDCSEGEDIQGEVSDEHHQECLGDINYPVMLDCPRNLLRILPYAMNEDITCDLFYVYFPDVLSKSHSKCRTIQGLPPSCSAYFDTDVDIISSWPICFEKSMDISTAIFIQTSAKNNTCSKKNTSHIVCKVSTHANIYICYDARASSIPLWMTILGFRSVGERIKTSQCNYQIYKKQYRACSWVRLGGNKKHIQKHLFQQNVYANMYFIVVLRCTPDEFIEPCISVLSQYNRYQQLPNFRVGDLFYADDLNQTLVELPSILMNKFLLLLQTFQADKTTSKCIKFQLQQKSVVYLCIDRQIVDIPMWIIDLGFIITPFVITGSDCSFFVYSRSFDAEIVTLGGLELPVWSYNNYFVLICNDSESSGAEYDDTTQGKQGPEADDVVSRGMPHTREFWNRKYGDISIAAPDFNKSMRRWSHSFNLTASNKGEVFASGCALSARIQSLVGVFHRTRVVTILPRFVIYNQLEYDLVILPFSTDDPNQTSLFPVLLVSEKTVIPRGSSCVLYHFPNIDSSRIGFTDIESEGALPFVLFECMDCPQTRPELACSPVCVNMIGEQFCWLVTNIHGHRRIVSAVVMSQGTVFSLTLTEATVHYPFRIENRSQAPVSFRQRNTGTEWVDLESMSWKAFVWPKPFMHNKVLEVCVAGYEQKWSDIQLDKVGNSGILRWDEGDGFDELKGYRWNCHVAKGELGFEVIVDVTTRVLNIFETSSRIHDNKSIVHSVSRHSHDSKVNKSSKLIYLECVNAHIYFNGFYCRLIDDEPVLGISIEKVSSKLIGEKSQFDFQVYHVQVDDLLQKARFPVIFAPLATGRNSHLQRSNVKSSNFMKMSCRWFLKEGSIIHLNYLDIVISELSVKLSMDLVIRLVSVLGKTASLWGTASQNTLAMKVSEVQALDTVLMFTISERIFQEASTLANVHFFIQSFHHSAIVIHLEVFVGSKSLHLDFNTMDQSITTGFAVLGGPMVSFISSVVGSIAHVSPVFVFNEFMVSNFFGNAQRLYHMLYTVLNQQAFAQAYKLFGSLELIGNPLSFIDNISTGVTDFYAHTLDEMEGTSSTRGEGVRRLAYSVIIGTFGTASRVSGSLADLSRVISGNKGAFAEEGHIGPENISEGLRQGGDVLLKSVAKGISGLVTEPQRGLEKEGLFGVMKGLGKGVIRLIASPLTGTLDAVSLVTESIEVGTQRIDGKPTGRIVRVMCIADESTVTVVFE